MISFPTRPAFRRALLGGLFAMLALPSVCLLPNSASAQNDPVIARVNGTEIRQSEIDAIEAELGRQLHMMDPEAKRDYLVTYVIDMHLVTKAAEAKKLAETPEFKRKLANARNRLLMEEMLEAASRTAVTDEAMRMVYTDAIKQVADEEEVSARHILVETEDEAKKILAELKKGGDFAAIAKDKSKDPGSKAKGGDLGFFSKEQMVPEFAEVAFKLPKGQLSEPLKTQFGWHIIRVDDRRKKVPPTFEEVKDQLASFVERRAQSEMVARLREGAKIERLDKPATSPATPPADPAKK
jgi:peptidyl-prolyl cis-trans isomerase C